MSNSNTRCRESVFIVIIIYYLFIYNYLTFEKLN